ncbi:uncharacterized protein LOC120838218 isoform X2 [Ixodes scapularis]|uniref:uncharacterized protein LOC120838218 isoform X2 n=1 Tax=Ixodes scapularis TaxID=6945 RepID=UPI001C37F778|nr:uncharacterized protein LOC120838218 isoform X2 [Ixodes scapularis]
MNEIFHEWMEVTTSKSVLATKAKLMRLCKSLPELNQQLLKHVLLILRRVCKNAPFTHTTPILAGHFVGPSLLWRPSSQFVAYPSEDVHRTLAKLVKCLILFLDDIWNDLNEEEMFPTLKLQATRDANGTQKPSDAFVGRSVPAYVDEMEQESRRNNRIRDVLQTSQEYASFELLPASSSSGNKVQASCPPSNPSGLQPRLNSRSVHTWPGCGKAKVGQAELDKSQLNDALLATGAGAVDRSKTATFPRCTPGAMLEDAESAFPSFGEDYLYPDWAFLYPEWDLSGDTLPGWATRSCFTLDLNSLAEQTTRKWIGINTQLFNKVSNLPVSEDGPFRHSELPGTKL